VHPDFPENRKHRRQQEAQDEDGIEKFLPIHAGREYPLPMRVETR
jgi:hypothetical protein